MMERRCDRCRRPIPDNVPQGSLCIVGMGFTINDFTGSSCSNEHYRDGDLCDSCARDLMDWFKGGPFIPLPTIRSEPPSEPGNPLDSAIGAIIKCIGSLAESVPTQDRVRVHELKILPDFFVLVWKGVKRFEIRKDDRGYRVGDWLDLKEWTEKGGYTGRHVKVRVGYKLTSDQAMGMLTEGCAVLGVTNPFPGRTCPYCGYPILASRSDENGGHACSRCGRDWSEGME